MKPRTIKAVIFDLGNTLLKHRRDYLDVAKRHCPHLHLRDFGRIASDILHMRIWTRLDDAAEEIVHRCGLEHNSRFKEELLHLLKDHSRFEKFRSTDPVLKTLRRRGYKIGLISNWSQNCFDVLDYHGLRPYFHSVAVSAYEGVRKPDHRIFRRVLKHLKVKPSEALMVGDHPEKDYAAAKMLGMHALLLDGKKKHQHSIRHLKQVLTYLKKVNGTL